MLNLVVYDNVTNDVYMSDLVNGRTDCNYQRLLLTINRRLLLLKDKYDIKINEAVYANPYSASSQFH